MRTRAVPAVLVALCAGCAVADEIAPPTIRIPGGALIAGSDRAEREHAYRLDEQGYGHSVTREQRWYEDELERRTVMLPVFDIMATLVTNAGYARFVAATGHPAPDVDAATWQRYGPIHPYERTRRHAWVRGAPPAGRDDHPVPGQPATPKPMRRGCRSRPADLAAEQLEWEKAARGTDGRWFPWGMTWHPSRANTHDLGPFDTSPVGAYPEGASFYGMLDPAGNVFEWTADAKPDTGRTRFMVKGGGSWDENGCGACRPAARHSRPADLKHILIGFRLVREVE